MRKRWWIPALVAGWAVVLLAVGVWSSRTGEPTVREQTDIATGRQTLDEAVALVVEVAGPDVATEVQPYEVTTDCRITLTRRGTELDQTVIMRVSAGQESALLERLAAELPESWGAGHTASDTLFADAGDFVVIRGEVPEPGEVRLTASTDCRPGTDQDLSQ